MNARDRNAVSQRERESRIERLIETHGCSALRVARRYSSSHADAEDAYQRALEIFLTKAPDGDERRLAAWLMTVVRNEALMIVRRRKHVVDIPIEEIGSDRSTGRLGPDEVLLDNERVLQGRTALARLTPDQIRCLLLRADGLSYEEIGDMTGFSYAKTHRCLSEGRKRFHLHVTAIDSGEECALIAPLLSLVADGEAGPAERSSVNAHVAGCIGCRKTLGEFRAAPASVAALLPIGVVVPSHSGAFERLVELFNAATANVQERLAPLISHPTVLDVGFAKKAALVTGVSATIVVGGATTQQLAFDEPTGGGRELESQIHAPIVPVSPTDRIGQNGTVGGETTAAIAERSAREAVEADTAGRQTGTGFDAPDAGSGNAMFDDSPQEAGPPLIEDPGAGVSPDEAADGELAP